MVGHSRDRFENFVACDRRIDASMNLGVVAGREDALESSKFVD